MNDQRLPNTIVRTVKVDNVTLDVALIGETFNVGNIVRDGNFNLAMVIETYNGSIVIEAIPSGTYEFDVLKHFIPGDVVWLFDAKKQNDKMTTAQIKSLIAETNRLRMKAVALLNRDIGTTYLINTERIASEKRMEEMMHDFKNLSIQVTEETSKPAIEILDLRLDPSIKLIIDLIIENENTIHEYYKK